MHAAFQGSSAPSYSAGAKLRRQLVLYKLMLGNTMAGLTNFFLAMIALGIVTFSACTVAGKRRRSSHDLKSRDLATLNKQALAAAKCAVAQFKSKAPVDATCPDCRQVISVTYIEPSSDRFVTKCKCQRSNRILQGVMGPPDRVVRSREHYKKEALKHSFLDAMFFVEYFNDKDGNYFQCPLAATDIFSEPDAHRVEQALEQSRRLNRGQNAYVGAAFFENSKAFDRAVKKLKEAHPGFCEDVYQTVIHDNIRGMR
jgi:hypothetical protein